MTCTKLPPPLRLTDQIGGWLRANRTARKLSQVQLAGRLGVTQVTVSAWEHSRHVPDFEQFMEIARTFGIHPADAVREIIDAHTANAHLGPLFAPLDLPEDRQHNMAQLFAGIPKES